MPFAIALLAILFWPYDGLAAGAGFPTAVVAAGCLYGATFVLTLAVGASLYDDDAVVSIFYSVGFSSSFFFSTGYCSS